jgi:hypothetical protein
MAEAIVAGQGRGPAGAIVVHYDGAFHSDYRQGTVDRVRRRAPNLRLTVLSARAGHRPVPQPHSRTMPVERTTSSSPNAFHPNHQHPRDP